MVESQLPDDQDLRLLNERGAAGLLRVFALIWFTLASASWLLAPSSNYEFIVAGLTLRPVYVGWLVGPIVWHLVKRSTIKPAIALMLWSFTLTPLLSAIHVSGLHNHILVVPPIAVMAAGWLLGWRHAAVLWSVVAVGHFFLLQRHQAGYPYLPDSATLKDWLVFGFANTVALALGVFTMRSFREQFRRVLGLSDDLERQVRALRLSEARFAEQFRANPLPSAIGDVDARILDVNEAWIRTFGVTHAAALGKRTDELGLWADAAPLADLVEAIRARGGVFGQPARMRVASGETRDFLAHVALINTQEGPRYINMLIDQTDRLAAEAAQHALNVELEARVAIRTAELQTAMEQLKATQQELVRAETLASLGNMVAGISHELNTPLGSALTAMTTLQESSGKIAAQAAEGRLRKSAFDDFFTSAQEISALTVRCIQRAADLVASFKQVAVDQVSEQRREFDLRRAVEDIVATLLPTVVKGTPWKIEIDMPYGLVCDSYPGVIGQILGSLVQNAARHGFAGRSAGTIRIHGQASGAQFELCVADDGIGMNAPTLAHVFDPFFTTTLGKGSSGIGLAVSRRLAASVLGGDLSATSALEAGSRFMLRAPRSAPGRV